MINNSSRSFFSKDKYYYFMYFYFFIMPWHFTKWQMGLLTLVLFVWCLYKFSGKIVTRLKNALNSKAIVLFSMYLLYSYVSCLWSDDISEAFKYVNRFFKYFILLIPIVYISLDEEKTLNCIKFLFLGFLSYSIFSLMIYFGLFDLKFGSSNNPKGIHAYAISTQYMGLGAIGFAIGALFTKYKYRFIILLFSIVCVSALFVNNSRTSIMAFCLTALILSLVYCYKNTLNFKRLILIITLLLSISFGLFNILDSNNKLKRFNVAYEEAKNVINANIYEGSLGSRLYMNKIAIEGFLKNPFFGFGPIDNDKYLEKQTSQKNEEYHSKIRNHYHSDHASILTRYGLIGYILLSSSILLIIYKLKDYKKYFYLSLGIFTFIFFTSLANTSLEKKPMVYVIFSLLILFAFLSYKVNEKKALRNN